MTFPLDKVLWKKRFQDVNCKCLCSIEFRYCNPENAILPFNIWSDGDGNYERLRFTLFLSWLLYYHSNTGLLKFLFQQLQRIFSKWWTIPTPFMGKIKLRAKCIYTRASQKNLSKIWPLIWRRLSLGTLEYIRVRTFVVFSYLLILCHSYISRSSKDACHCWPDPKSLAATVGQSYLGEYPAKILRKNPHETSAVHRISFKMKQENL